MTTQGERHTHRAHGSRRRTIALCSVGAVAITLGVVVAKTGDWLEGAGRTIQVVSSDSVPPVQPLSEKDFFVAERYFPAAKPIEQDGFKALRTAGRQGEPCVETMADRARDVLRDTGCLGYVTVGYLREDRQVTSSVTVLRFADQAGAEKARQVLAADSTAIAFVTADPAATPAASGSPSPGAAKPVTSTQVEAVGHYLTVTSSRFADQRATVTDNTLDTATRAVSFTARAPFMWL
ncbi:MULTISPECIES: hypothetical protein [unclassified Kitasatospora]|uniref:hypothetical protein n=1 Tax=unclassified Kitasatospora TaxID=2633591 RepID=UPI00070B1A9B|nr:MULTISPECIES: hypothetical protein [unclassified Kitasatospora]KQV17185.1 hypothetical protein ASC99_26670 [Kitasatospora sp. Root107]KRB69966.1 hypothetical protein ASE03_25195 [Kitasatospora sp. Root187]